MMYTLTKKGMLSAACLNCKWYGEFCSVCHKTSPPHGTYQTHRHTEMPNIHIAEIRWVVWMCITILES